MRVDYSIICECYFQPYRIGRVFIFSSSSYLFFRVFFYGVLAFCKRLPLLSVRRIIMCGIAGVMISGRGGSIPDSLLSQMKDALISRGPDGSGVYKADRVGLVHTRLSIIDLEEGAQPLKDSKGRVVVFNGEIYNYIELRKDLFESFSFKTHSDTEVILALYDRYGVEFFKHLRGMFAIALYDPASPLRIKAFGSDAKASICSFSA